MGNAGTLRLNRGCRTIALVSNILRGMVLDAQSFQEVKRGGLQVVDLSDALQPLSPLAALDSRLQVGIDFIIVS